MLRSLAMLLALVVFMMGLPFAALAEEVSIESLIVAQQDVAEVPEEEAPEAEIEDAEVELIGC